METWVIVILVFLGVGLIGLAIFQLVRYFERVRREGLERFATELSLDFFPDEQSDLMQRLQAFKLFNAGHSRKMVNVIVGRTEVVNIAIFDYRYITGSGKHQHVHNQTVVAMESDELDIPSFTLRPESLFDWFGSVLGFQDIDFEEHPQFSKMFVLKGENEQVIRKFFDAELLDFFAEKKGITFEAIPGRFIYFRGGRKTNVESMRDYLEEGYSVYAAFLARKARG